MEVLPEVEVLTKPEVLTEVEVLEEVVVEATAGELAMLPRTPPC